MDLYAKYRNEGHPVYQRMESANYTRYSGFLESVIESAIESQQGWLSEPLIKAINFQATVALYLEAGEYRARAVDVGDYIPPPPGQIASAMTALVNEVNRRWEQEDAIKLAVYALWRINQIHPFVNGNGRTARAICYFIICVKAGGTLPGNPTLPELLRREPTRSEYVNGLKWADSNGDLSKLATLIQRLITQQLQ